MTIVTCARCGTRHQAYAPCPKAAFPNDVPQPCKTCGATGFSPSREAGKCEFCDGTFGGNPPAFDEGGTLDLFEALEEVFGPGQDMGDGIVIFTRPPLSS